MKHLMLIAILIIEFSVNLLVDIYSLSLIYLSRGYVGLETMLLLWVMPKYYRMHMHMEIVLYIRMPPFEAEARYIRMHRYLVIV
jgi:hypothetical protein